jgi:hypothetical protein
MGRHGQCCDQDNIALPAKKEIIVITTSLAFVSTSQDLMHILYDQSDHHW